MFIITVHEERSWYPSNVFCFGLVEDAADFLNEILREHSNVDFYRGELNKQGWEEVEVFNWYMDDIENADYEFTESRLQVLLEGLKDLECYDHDHPTQCLYGCSGCQIITDNELVRPCTDNDCECLNDCSCTQLVKCG
jgi:hypothetical protein